jgi:predicted ferric reductase
MTNIEIINLIQRITGLVAFFLITLQIILSSNRKYIRYHMLNGILAYTFVFIHPILMIVSRYLFNSDFDPFYVYTDACVMCNSIYEHYINLGRLALYITTLTVITARFKNYLSDWFKTNWRKLHILNYLAFYFVSIHAIKIGSDVSKNWFIYFFWFCQIVVAWAIYNKVKFFFQKR